MVERRAAWRHPQPLNRPNQNTVDLWGILGETQNARKGILQTIQRNGRDD
jgi:hypothetical protein